MVKRMGWLFVCALAIGLAGGARAQQGGSESDLGLDNWEIRLGMFVPQDEAMRKAGGDVWFTVGAERPFYQADRYKGSISLDYYGNNNYYNIPILLNLSSETNRLRYGLGGGVSFGRALEHSPTAFAYQLLVGYTLIQGSKPLVADLRYRGAAYGKGVLNGWAFAVGLRF